MSETDDAAALLAWRAGDREAGRRIVDAHYPALARFFVHKVGDDADDLVHRVFLACVESKAEFRAEASVRTYLFTIARHELYAWFRGRRRANAHDAFDSEQVSLADVGESPSQHVARKEEQRLLLAALRRIPIAAQLTLELYYWESLTTREIAEILDVPHGTMRNRLRAARHRLEAEMGAITRSRELIDSTLDDLGRWLRSVRAHVPDKGPA